MDIYVFNQNFEIQGVIDSFESLIWRRSYYKTGDFELHLKLPAKDEDAANLVYLLQKDHILVKEDSMEEAGYIKKIELDDTDEADSMIITGFFINNIIAERIVWGTMNKSGTVEDVIKYFVSRNAVTPDDPKRIIPHLQLHPNRNIPIHADEVNSYSNLADLVEELTLKYDVGYRVLFDLTNQAYVFDIYQGNDLSINQDINPHAIFSLEYENVLDQSYTDSDDNYKNMALVGGQGEGLERVLVTINEELSGFNRRELFVDAKDLSTTREDESIMTQQEYQEALKQRGESKLAETQTIQTFESGISLRSNMMYKEDFDLGDIITIQNERWGIQLNTRITVVEEVYENDTKDIKVNFGSNIPTLVDKLQQKMK